MELTYTHWGKTQTHAPKVVLLHGMGGSGSLWRPIAAQLEDQLQILAPDQRGHGGSRPAGPGFTPLDFGKDLQETLEIADFYPAWIVGHSMGARTACALAHLKPEYVQGLVLVDLGFQGLAGGGFGENLSALLKLLPMQFKSRAAARDFLEKHSPDASITQYLLAVSQPVRKDQPSGEITFPFDRESLLETVEGARNTSLRSWVQEFDAHKIPTLALRGGESRVWSKSDFEEEKKLFSDYSHVVFEEMPGAGHGLPFEKRKEFCERLLRWIQTAR